MNCMKKIYYLNKNLVLLFLCCLLSFTAQAQCDITTFTATPVNGVCVQDGAVQVAIPGASGCTGTVATIREVGATTDLDFITLSATGSGQFNNLPPGDYEIRISQGAASAGPLSVTVVSSYLPLTVAANAQNVSCGTGDPLYDENGEVEVTFTGGIGPYTITLTGPGGPYTFNVPTPTTHTFTGLAPGSYIATVADNSSLCTSAEAASVAIEDSPWVPMSLYMIRRLVHTTCELYFRIEMNHGNRLATLEPGNATYTIAGDPTVYNLINLTMPATGRYLFRTQYGLPANTDITFTISDGCRTLSYTRNTQDIGEVFNYDMSVQTDENCTPSFYLNYRLFSPLVQSTHYWHLSPGSTVSFYVESPPDSDNWTGPVEVQSAINLWEIANDLNFTYPDVNTRYRMVMEDVNGCNAYERIVDARLAAAAQPLEYIQLHQIPSILEGTSAIGVRKGTGGWLLDNADGIRFPITISIARADGQTNMTINPSHPYTLAGSYNISFPYQVISNPDSWFNGRPILGDLPLGEYNVTFTDACGYSVIRSINLTDGVTYDPEIEVIQGCANSNIIYNMNGTNVINRSLVRLRQNNGGALGPVIRDQFENPSFLLSGQFSTVPPGEYFVEYTNINYQDRYFMSPQNTNAGSNYSIARNTTGINRSYYVPVTVSPYQTMTFNSAVLFCDHNDPSSGILAVSTNGIAVGYINYQVWDASANPNTDPALQEYLTTNLTETSHTFTGLTQGTYIVRVSTSCGYTEQTLILTSITALPGPVADPPVICAGEESTLSIALPTSLFDIDWYDADNNHIGSGNAVTVSPLVETTYAVEYELRSTFGCTNPISDTEDITVSIHPEVQLVDVQTNCATDDSGYTLTIEVDGMAPYTATGTGAPGIWTGNVWTSGLIAVGTDYAVFIQDANGCNELEITGEAPEIPVIIDNIGDTGVCHNAGVTITIDANNVSSYIWEYSTDGINWDEVSGSTLTEITVSGADLVIAKALVSYNGLRFRVNLMGSAGCVVISEEITLTVKNCTVVTNPMMINRARK